jgi:DNA-binding response OmpR family regulator
LLVADRNLSTLGLKQRLAEGGMTAEVASNHKEVQRKTLQPGCRLIVLDLLWSRADPLTSLQHWRRGGLRQHVLALASDRNTSQTVQALEFGADDVLRRPFEVAEFLARVRALLRRSEPPRNKVLHVHDLKIDCHAHQVCRNGRTISLTPREFTILAMLAEQPGRVVSRGMIWQRLYPEGGRCTSNVVDVYIRYLRNKIDRHSAVPLILTSWGQGYLLRGEENG